jgi:hypothetical protein
MPDNQDGAPSLPERVASLAAEIARIVLNGLEHPTYELKRAVTLSKDRLADRLDFVKLIQGLSNSHKDTECIIVIGADEQNRCFVDVPNAESFNAAKLSPILRKYLEPEATVHSLQGHEGFDGGAVCGPGHPLPPRPSYICNGSRRMRRQIAFQARRHLD